MGLVGIKIFDNLKEVFVGESQVNCCYLYFVQKVDVEGYNDVVIVF